MGADRVPWVGPTPPARSKHRRVLIRAPSEVQSVGILVAEGLVLAVLFGFPPGQAVPFLPGLILLFLVPMLGAAVLTGPIAAAFGGRLTLKRGLLLSVTAGLLPIPLAIAWRV
ncbi:MAG TPA: hypothetical protein VLY85_04710, partial [Thermoplasmata archaeon]|nr:hypothetical protein [Thermoplasmata archaeon]